MMGWPTLSTLLGQTTLPVPVPTEIKALDDFDPHGITGTDIVIAVVALVVALILSRFVRRATRHTMERIGTPESAARTAGRLAGWTVIVVGLILALQTIGFEFGPILFILLLVIIVAFLVGRPLLTNIGAGLTIHARAPFSVGDQIATTELEGESLEGTVREINARAVVISTVDGRRVMVPNSTVLGGPIVNYTAEGRRRTGLDVGVRYSTDLDAAQAALVAATSSVDGVSAEPAPSAFVHEFGDSSIVFRVFFWHEPDLMEAWIVRDRVARALKQALDRDGIVIAFPQRVLWWGDDQRPSTAAAGAHAHR